MDDGSGRAAQSFSGRFDSTRRTVRRRRAGRLVALPRKALRFRQHCAGKAASSPPLEGDMAVKNGAVWVCVPQAESRFGKARAFARLGGIVDPFGKRPA
jgi:hypothetical protein